MLCDNCGRREANVRYSENINGKVRELNLCEECSKKLGISNMDFNMPIDFSSFFGEFMDYFDKPEFMPLFSNVKTLKCNNCGNTFEDIANTGKLGCEECYDVFGEKLDNIIRKIQGANHHVGRTGKIIDSKIDEKLQEKNIEDKNKIESQSSENKSEENKELQELKSKLKQAIKEEKYEEAAKLRDQIKELEDK